MTNASPPEPHMLQDRLLKAKLRELLTWTVPPISQTVGPFDPDAFMAFESRRRALVDEVRALFDTFTPEQATKLLSEAESRTDPLLAVWHSYRSDEIRQLRNQVPPWFAGGFGHPDYQADFDYWAKMPRFKVDELVCVSVGVEPQHFPRMVLDRIVTKDLGELRPQFQFLRRRYEQLKRQFDPQGLKWTVTPRDFIAWVDRVEFDVHDEFISRLRRHNGGTASTKAAQAATLAEPDKREIDKIAQLFTAIVIREYGYDPSQSRSPIPSEIANVASSMGLSVTDDTIRKYLKIGSRFLPADWKPE